MREFSLSQNGDGASQGHSAGGSAAVALDAPAPGATRRMRAAHLLMICGLLLAAVGGVGTGGVVLVLRARAVAAAESELSTTARVLAEQTDRAFQTVEFLQAGLLDRMKASGIASARDYGRLMSGRDVHLMLKDKVAGRPHIGAITLINSQGKLFNFSRF